MNDPERLMGDLEEAGEAYASFIETLSSEEYHNRPAPEEWTPAEITGHLSEALVTFAGQARRVSQQPGLAIGRDPDDPGRLAAVGRFEDSTQVEAAEAMRAAIRESISILREIPQAGWQATASHRHYGEISVEGIVERILVAHCRTHLAQAQAAATAVKE